MATEVTTSPTSSKGSPSGFGGLFTTPPHTSPPCHTVKPSPASTLAKLILSPTTRLEIAGEPAHDGDDDKVTHPAPKCFSWVSPLRPPQTRRRKALRRTLFVEEEKENSPPRPRRRSPAADSPLGEMVVNVCEQDAAGAQRRSVFSFYRALIAEWLLTDHPDGTCLYYLGMDGSDEFLTKYTQLKQTRDTKLRETFERQAAPFTKHYGNLFAEIFSSHLFSLLLAHRSNSLQESLFKLLKEKSQWRQLVTAITELLFSTLESSGTTREAVEAMIDGNDIAALQALVTHLHAKIEKGESDANKLLLIILDPRNCRLFINYWKKLPADPAHHSRALSCYLLSQVCGHVITHSQLMLALNFAFEQIEINPLAHLLALQTHPVDGTLSPSIKSLLEQQLAHSNERFRLLPLLYVIYVNQLSFLYRIVPPKQHATLKDLFLHLTSLGQQREHVSRLYRQTQAHEAVSAEERANQRRLGRAAYRAAGVEPPLSPTPAAEGAHTLPNPGAFSLDPRSVAEAFRHQGFATPPIPEEGDFSPIDAKSPQVLKVKTYIRANTKGIINEETFTRTVEKELQKLAHQDPVLFVWNTYWLIAEMHLFAFSETQYFPSYVNHNLDSLSENKELLAQALTSLFETSFEKREPLNLDDAHKALAPLYREALEKSRTCATTNRAKFKKTESLQPLLFFWMALNVGLTIPRPHSPPPEDGDGAGSA